MTKDIFITLNMIKEHNPCTGGWETLLKSLNKTEADDAPLKFSYIAESNGVADALWCLRVLKDNHKEEVILLLADIADSVLHTYENEYPLDSRVRDCIVAVQKYAKDEITKEELSTRRRAANAAADAANAAAGYAPNAVAYAAAAAAVDAANAAAAVDVGAVAGYAAAAANYAYAAASYAAGGAERQKQKDFIIKHLG